MSRVRLRDQLDMANGCLHEIHEMLATILGKDAMAATPPMFYPEAIMSACARAASVAAYTGNPKPSLPLPESRQYVQVPRAYPNGDEPR